ncbi:hypothetical protein DY000_02023527 [Brassica cretica]|uniref:REJ domain-containing protein n=1 Tax=Brassica cretica TaxID=69181 RepID=A0ABQ7E2K8_BRACR|nr:hypothetical protein DY000_02023527 [Brassica cretica]
MTSPRRNQPMRSRLRLSLDLLEDSSSLSIASTPPRLSLDLLNDSSSLSVSLTLVSLYLVDASSLSISSTPPRLSVSP